MSIMNQLLKNILRTALAGIAAGALAVSCNDKFDLELPLSVNSHKLSIPKESGSTHILVYSDGKWTAGFTEAADWVSLNKLSGEGNHDLVLSWSANYGIARKVGIVLNKGSLCDTITVTQAGSLSDISLGFSNSAMNLLKTSASISAPISTNLMYDLDRITAETLFLGAEGDTLAIVKMGEEEAASGYEPWLTAKAITSKNFKFDVTENTSEAPRTAVITMYVEDATGENRKSSMTVTQGISEPVFSLSEDSGEYAGYKGTYSVETLDNNIYAYTNNYSLTVNYSNPDDEENKWLSGVKLTGTSLDFSVSKNESGADRTATIVMEYSDDSGNSISSSFVVSQLAYPDPLSFEELRALAPGELTSKQYIEGYVVSDPGSANIAKNTQTAQFKFDFNENYKTSYLESIDGRYGVMLKFKTMEDNIIERYSKVRIAIEGAKLQRYDNPVRYVVSGLTAESVIEAGTPDSFLVPAKKRKISELTDNDIYTLVDLQDVEILSKDGSYTNCTDGYSIRDDGKGINPSGTTSAPRWDTAPLMVTDTEGSFISLLTNSYVAWRREPLGSNNPTFLPQGSGTIHGVIVFEENPRYGSYSKYQVRAMVEEDIELENSPFSNTIVEWNWNDKVNNIVPEKGEGTMNVYGATFALSTDFNNTVSKDATGSNQKGLIPSAAIKLTNSWWDFTADEGKYFDINFSTAGLNGSNLVVGIVWGHGEMGKTTLDSPAHWKMLYSVDGGTTFKDVDGGILKNRSVVWFTTTSQDSCPGFEEYLRKLPAECFGKENVTVRFQVADKVTDISPKISASDWQNNLGIEKGTLTNKSTGIRIGTLTVRYN